jgi:hypothetical protein
LPDSTATAEQAAEKLIEQSSPQALKRKTFSAA